jgi:hypothetical protein
MKVSFEKLAGNRYRAVINQEVAGIVYKAETGGWKVEGSKNPIASKTRAQAARLYFTAALARSR